MTLEVRYDLAEGDRSVLAELYADTWFGETREGVALDRMLTDTDAMVALYDGADLVAFGHAVSDGAFVAYLRDLVVARDHRRTGIGRRLVEELCAHPELGDVTEIALTCPDRLAPFYEASGFERRDGAVVMRMAES